MDITIINEETHQANGITMHVLTVDVDDILEIFRGTAERHPEDKNRPAIGRALAQARAYRSLAKTLERRAAGLVKHADDVANMEHKPNPAKKATKATTTRARARSMSV